MIRPSAVAVVLALAFAAPLRAEITADQAAALAQAAAVAQHAEFGQPGTSVKTAFSDQVIALDISDPYRLNGQVYWRNYTHYETTKVSVATYTGIGDDVHATAAAQPMPAMVPDELKPKVLEYLQWVHVHGSLDPELRIGAHLTRAWGFHYHHGDLFGPSAFIGVDADGHVFRLDVNGPLTSWETVRAKLFDLLYQAIP